MDELLNSELFTITALTRAINETVFAPRPLAQLGLFSEEGIQTTAFRIEKSGDSLGLVETRERGTRGEVVTGDKRTMLTFGTVHLPTTAVIRADEVQGVRAFGSAANFASLETLRDQRLGKMAQKLDITHEYHRIGAMKGKVLDADGKTVIADLFTAFGIKQTTLSFDFAKLDGTAGVQLRCLDVLETLEKAMGNSIWSGARAFVGTNFWRELIKHPSVAETYRYQMSQRLRDDLREDFDFGGITWQRYRGGINNEPFVDANEAYVEPIGTMDKLISFYAPADYMDTVNTIGLPFYSSAYPLPHNKGIELEGQSNPFHLNTKPGASIKLTCPAK